MRTWPNILVLSLLSLPLSAQAEEPLVPRAGWFAGLGGSLNGVDFDQDLFAAGIGAVYVGSTLVAAGGAGGPAASRQHTEWALAPEAQLGYFAHFEASDWLWGGKVVYRYVNASARTSDIAPQTGELKTISGPDTFTGNVVIGAYRSKLEHLFAFMPFIGHSFARSTVYLGAGPALLGTQTNVDNAVGFADVNGLHGDATGAPANYSSSQWVWGLAAQIGLTYFLDQDWFFDVNYTYTRSENFKSHFSSPFQGQTPPYSDVGILFVDPSERLTDQSLSVSINRRF